MVKTLSSTVELDLGEDSGSQLGGHVTCCFEDLSAGEELDINQVDRVSWLLIAGHG